MTKESNNLFVMKLGIWVFWIVSGLVCIKTGSAVFIIFPIIYTILQNKKLRETNK